MEKLYSLSPIDGRYHLKVDELRDYFSELSLINHRIYVECEYFIFLIHYLHSKKKLDKNLSKKEIDEIREIYKYKDKNAFEVKKIEFLGDKNIKPTNHDVKAVEYYLKKNFSKKIKNNIEFVHFGLTSEDVNNISYSIMISRFIKEIYLPQIGLLLNSLSKFINKYYAAPFPARTHGQIASSTTFGKEIKVFYERIRRKRNLIKNDVLSVKLNGAVGNYNSFFAAYPEINWIDFTKKFIRYLSHNLKIELKTNLFTTQIENHDSWVELFDDIKHMNSILIGFSQDIWRYISDEFLCLKPVDGEVGSSTMPHKINPINFENAEGNFQIANSLFELFSAKLPISRLQRDLTDSTVERNIGVAFAHTIIAVKSLIEGLSKIDLDEAKALKIIKSHPEVYSEAIQTILRKYGFKEAYEELKKLTRGNKVTEKELENFVEKLNITEKAKKEIKYVLLKPYTGIADKLAIYKTEE
ncbi:MAG: adenylosuccinate lyase [Elusimicrobiota bacterium]